MSSPAEIVYFTSWFAQPVLQTAVIGVMWKRGLRQTFPMFFALNVFETVCSVAIISLFFRASYAAYFYVTWTSVTIDLALMFMVIHEIFQNVFKPFHTLKDLGTVVFKWAALVMVIVSAVVAAASTSSPLGPIMQGILTTQRCVRLMQLGLVLFLIVFSKYLGSSWRQQSFGIALGFGFFAMTELIGVSLRSSSALSERMMNLAVVSAYDVAIVTWLAYMWLVQPRQQAVVQFASQRWEQSLADIRHPMPADSLIPMFESMVEQAFSQGKNENLSLIDALTGSPKPSPDFPIPTSVGNRPK